MGFRNYGRGNNAQAIMRIRRQNRRIAEHVSTTDKRDIGVRPEMGEILGFGEGIEIVCTCGCDKCKAGDHTCGKLPCEEARLAAERRK